jgi:hypothetical protein
MTTLAMMELRGSVVGDMDRDTLLAPLTTSRCSTRPIIPSSIPILKFFNGQCGVISV